MATTVASMATKSSDLKDWMSGANLQTEGHTPMPLRGQRDPEEMGALGSAPSHLPSWSLARKPSPSGPNTRHCLGIHVTLTEETGATPPTPHAWMAPVVEDMPSPWQNRSHQSHSDGPRLGCPLLWEMVIGRGSEPRQGERCHIHTYRSGHLGW